MLVDEDRSAGNVGGKPGSVGGGNQDVLAPIADVDRDPDLSDVESPRRQERQGRRRPSPRPRRGTPPSSTMRRPAGRRRGPAPRGRRRKAANRQRKPWTSRRPSARDPLRRAGKVTMQYRQTLPGPVELLDVLRIHSVRPVEAVRFEGGHPNHAFGQRHPVRQPGRDGEGMRSAAGTSGHRKSRNAKSVDNGLDIAHAVHRPPPRSPVGDAVTRPVVGDQVDARAANGLGVGVPGEPGTGRAVQRQHRRPGRIAPLRHPSKRPSTVETVRNDSATGAVPR